MGELRPVRRPERRLERQHLVERQAEAVDVAARVRLADEPLGGQVAQRADHVARARQLVIPLRLGQAEVGHPERPLDVQQQVGRLDVAMDDPVGVRVGQRLRRLHGHPCHLAAGLQFGKYRDRRGGRSHLGVRSARFGRRRRDDLARSGRVRSLGIPARQEPGVRPGRHVARPGFGGGPRPDGLPACPVELAQHDVEAPALDVLHGVIRDALVFAHAEDRDDIGMVQERGRPRLAPEPDQRGRPQESIARQHLQRHATAQALLHRLVDDPHAPAADLPEDPVVAQPLGHRPAAPRPILDGPLVRVGIAADPLHHHQRGEQLADLAGQVRVAVGIFAERRPFAPPVSLGEFVRQVVEQVRSGLRLSHGQGSSQSPPRPLRMSLSRRSART